MGRSKSGGTGTVIGLMSSIHPKVDIALLARNFDVDFHSFRGYVFADRPTALANEQGLYFGIKVKPSTKWTLSSFFDQYKFPWLKYQVDMPSKGYETITQIDYQPSKKITATLRFRSDNKEQNSSLEIPGQNLEYLTKIQRNYLRFNFSCKVDNHLSFKTRIENVWYRENQNNQNGLVFLQDVVWTVRKGVKVVGRYAIFDTDSYDSRIYAYENDVYGAFSIPGYSGRGSRYYLMLQLSPIKALDIWIRYAQTTYIDREVISSGLEEIQGNAKSELKLQVRYSF